MKAKNDLTGEYVRTILGYDPATGVLRWKKTLSKRAVAGSLAGTRRKDGRRIVAIDGRDYVAARIIWLLMTGDWPPGDIDHCNREREDDRWNNLRPATRSQNHFNKGRRKDNTSGLKGVELHHTGKWVARICAHHQRIYLGSFETREEAGIAYREAATRLHGEFACDGRNP